MSAISSHEPDENAEFGDKFNAALGNLVIKWNRAELHLRWLLDSFIGGPNALVVTSELGAVGLANALRTFANETTSGPLREAIIHLLDYTDTTRAYRNYYVHGVVVLKNINSAEVGYVQTFSAKGSMTKHHEQVSIEQIDKIAAHAVILADYALAVLHHSVDPSDDIPKLPEPPPLPEKLKKPRQSLQWLWQPPQSSPA